MIETSVINEIIELIERGNFQLICIDGIDGVGKSTLADKLSVSLGFSSINLDDYVEEEKGNFVDFLNLARLSAAINESKQAIIIEGICLLEVLSKIDRSPDLLIYIKRMSSYGSWRDEEECEITEDIEEFIQKKKQDLKEFCIAEARIEGREFNENEFSFPALREEIFRYHYKHSPHKKAGVLFIRKSC